MALGDARTYECVTCGFSADATDALLSTCRRCGGEMRNVERIHD